MLDLVNAYLADPSLDAAGRHRVVMEQCEFTDGKSADRVGRVMAAVLTRRSATSAAPARRNADPVAPVELNVPR